MTKEMSRPSATVVAKIAGVSQSAVSRAFTDGASISPAMRQKVMEAAKQVGYRPNAIARSLITRHTNIVGVVVADFINPIYTDILAELSAQLQERGKNILLFTVGPGQSVDDILSRILQYQVDTVIVAAATISSAMADECIKRGTPVILFNRTVANTAAHVVAVDNYAGGVIAAETLIAAGHKRFGYISGHKNTSTSLDRERGFHEGLMRHGVKDIMSYDGQYSYEGARQAGRQLLARARRPDAIFCANDLLALGMIDAARELGVIVPDELSIIGFDDIPQAGWSGYSLTTLRQPIDVMVKEVVDIVVSVDANETAKPIVRLLPPSLVPRSTSCPKKSGRK